MFIHTRTSFMVFFIIVSILFFTKNLISQNLQKDLFTAGNRLAFGNSLFDEQDYLRAIDEYHACLKYNYNDTIEFKIAYAYQAMGDYSQAEDYFKGLFFNSSFYHEARTEYYKTNFLKLNSGDFRNLVDDNYFITEVNKTNIYSLYNTTYFFDDDLLPDSISFIAPFKQKYKNDIAEFYYRKLNPENKDITTGLILSAILPGVGKVYADQLTDGLTAFLVTGLCAFLSYDNFKADHDFRGWLFAGLAAYFYAGNLYGTAAAIQQYNAGLKLNFENEVKFYLKNNNYLLPGYDF